MFVDVVMLDHGVLRLVENGQERDLGTTSGHGQLVGDALLHVRNGVLLSQRLDPDTRQPSAMPCPSRSSTVVGTSGHSFFTASGRLLIAAPAVKRLRQLTHSEQAGRHADVLPGDDWQVPNSSTIATLPSPSPLPS